MNLIRRLAVSGALLFAAANTVDAQVVERPVSFDSAGRVVVMTPYIAQRAALRAPWWPVAGDFTEARLYAVNDTYVLAVNRPSGVVERFNLSAADREAISAIVSRLPGDVIASRVNARNSFVRGQTLLGVTVYGPAFAGTIRNNGAGQVAGYLVVAGGSFFAASEISRRMLITRPQSDLSFNMGHNIALAGFATSYLFGADDGPPQAASTLVGGLVGTALGLRFARGMTEADAVGTGFGSDLGALIGLGVSEAVRGDGGCGGVDIGSTCGTDKAEIATILASGLVGYPLGLLYPRNARYHVTAGDINTLWPGALVGGLAGAALLHESPSVRAAASAVTAGGVLGVILADRFLVQRADHSRTEATQLLFGTVAGSLVGAGVANLFVNAHHSPEPVFALSAIGGLAGIIGTEIYLQPSGDAGQQRFSVTFNPTAIALTAARTPGNHSLINVRF